MPPVIPETKNARYAKCVSGISFEDWTGSNREQAMHGLQQICTGKRLGQRRVGAVVGGTEHHFVYGRNDEYGRGFVARVGFDVFDEGEAAGCRQHDVARDEVERRVFREDLHGFLHAFGGLWRVPGGS